VSKRPRDEFFEVFRRSPGETKQHTLWAGIGSRSGDRSARRRVLTLSYGTLALCVTVAMALTIMAYAVGYSRGKARRGAGAPVGGPAPVNSERPVGSIPPVASGGVEENAAPPAPGEPFYTVRVMSAVPLANAMRLRDDLRAMGYRDVFVYDGRGSTGYTVNIGRFSALQERAALDLKETVRKQAYKGKRLFEDCYLTRISALGRIIE